MRIPGRLVLFAMLFAMVAGFGSARGQQAAAPDGVTQTPPTVEKPNPLKRRLSDKERIAQQKDLKNELHGVYKTWLEQDVRWIITDTEQQAFKRLTNDEERDAFIENFWQRRNPSPDSPENEYRDEIYARIAYANEHYAAGKPGWMTDRGHIYIAYGKPDDIDSHPSGGEYERPMDEGGGSTATFPFEVWHYRYIEGIGENIDLEFVDTCQCGDYHYTIDRSEKDALKMVPNAGLTQSEQNGQSSKADRFGGSNYEQLGLGPMNQMNQNKEFDRIDLQAKIMAPPPIKFQDLEDSDRSDLPLRCAHGLCEGDQRYGECADHGADTELGHHVQHQGRSVDWEGGDPGTGLEYDPQDGADLRRCGVGRYSGGAAWGKAEDPVGLLGFAGSAAGTV
jgi:GWxTD domain-containing protein